LLFFALEREWFRDMSGSSELRDQAHEMAQRAIALDENDTLCQQAMGWAYFNRGDYELAERHITKALELNPNGAQVQASIAAYYNNLGQPEKAIACLAEAKSIDPFFSPSWYWVELGVAHFIARRYGEAIASLRRAGNLSPTLQAWLAASYANANQPDHATTCAAELMRRMPSFSVSRYLAKLYLVRSEDLQHLADGLRKAGLPE
jgi:adenylate cyclase